MIRGEHRFKAVFVTLALVAFATACSSTGVASPDPDDPFAVLIDTQTRVAEAGGASPEQLQILRDAQAAGVLEYEPFKQAVEATFACFRDHGIRYNRMNSGSSTEYPILTYQYESPPDGPSPDAAACITANSRWVEMIYQTQPAAQEADDAAFEAALPILIPCLREQGFLGPEEPTVDEVHTAIWDAFDYVEENPGSGLDPTYCPRKANVSDF